MPEGQTGEERRQNRYGNKPIQRQQSKITARIPLPPQCAHWSTFPSGEGIGYRTLHILDGLYTKNRASCAL